MRNSSSRPVWRYAQAAVIGIGALLLVYALWLLFTGRINLNVGLFVNLGLGLLFVVYGLVFQQVRRWRWLHILVASGCAFIIGLAAFLFAYGNNHTVRYDEDAVVVLGASLHGGRISNTLARRLDAAVYYHGRNPAAIVVVSGGQGWQETTTEASLMAQYLIDHGVPAGQIIQEGNSTSTEENFLFTSQILDEKFPDGYTAAFITNDFHIYRAHAIATRLGVADRHLSAPITWYLIPITYLRETVAMAQHWLRTALNAS